MPNPPANQDRAIAATCTMIEALHNIAGECCSNFFSRPGEDRYRCHKNGRSEYAIYGDERCCDACIANRALIDAGARS